MNPRPFLKKSVPVQAFKFTGNYDQTPPIFLTEPGYMKRGDFVVQDKERVYAVSAEDFERDYEENK